MVIDLRNYQSLADDYSKRSSVPQMKTIVSAKACSEHIVIQSVIAGLNSYGSYSELDFHLCANEPSRSFKELKTIVDRHACEIGALMEAENKKRKAAAALASIGCIESEQLGVLKNLYYQDYSAPPLKTGLGALIDKCTPATNIFKPKEKSMFKGLSDDMRGFIKDNKAVLYWIALIMIVDHYFFENHFRDKLKQLVFGLIGKVEKDLNIPQHYADTEIKPMGSPNHG